MSDNVLESQFCRKCGRKTHYRPTKHGKLCAVCFNDVMRVERLEYQSERQMANASVGKIELPKTQHRAFRAPRVNGVICSVPKKTVSVKQKVGYGPYNNQCWQPPDDEVIHEPLEFVDFQPTSAQPGSEDKIMVLCERYLAGLPLFHPRDEPQLARLC